jgi:hypothetical protein
VMTGGFGRPFSFSRSTSAPSNKMGASGTADANAVTQSSRNMAGAPFPGFHRRCVMIFVEGLDDLLDVLKQMAPVLVLLSTAAILWWRSAHLAR